MSAVTRDYIIEQGAIFTRVYSKKDTDGNLIPLAGYGARMQARTSIGSSEKIIDLDSQVGGTTELTVNTSTNKITLSLSAVTTAALMKTTLVYDLEVYNISDPTIVYRWLEGKLTLSKEVTR